MSLKSTTLIVATILIAFACSEEPDDFALVEGKEYFPLEVGKFRQYQVDSIIFDPDVNGIRRDTSRTFVREEIVELFQDQSGNDVYRVERFERKSVNDGWEVKLVYSMEKTEDAGFQTENNLRLKMITFPFSEETSWKATSFINPDLLIQVAGENIKMYKDWTSSFAGIAQNETVNGNQFDEVTTVLHQNGDTNPFERRYIQEKYAKGVGLVAREMIIFDSDYCNEEPAPADCLTIAWEDKAEKGFILNQVISDFN